MNNKTVFFRSFYLLVFFCFIITGCAQNNFTPCVNEYEYVYDTINTVPIPVDMNNVRIRDPFIFLDKKTKTYYLPQNGVLTGAGNTITMFTSKDLKNWSFVSRAFIPNDCYWGKSEFWAQSMYYYQDKYYIVMSPRAKNGDRGISILIGDKPEGPYMPLFNEPIDPSSMTIDGTLYFDENDTPWLVYRKENDIMVQKRNMDLKEAEEPSIALFNTKIASPWENASYLAEAPFVYRVKGGSLILLWATFFQNNYVIRMSYSNSGNILGPWIHNEKALFDKDGAHAMIFRTTDGKEILSYHSPNTAKNERLILMPISFENQRLQIIK